MMSSQDSEIVFLCAVSKYNTPHSLLDSICTHSLLGFFFQYHHLPSNGQELDPSTTISACACRTLLCERSAGALPAGEATEGRPHSIGMLDGPAVLAAAMLTSPAADDPSPISSPQRNSANIQAPDRPELLEALEQLLAPALHSRYVLTVIETSTRGNTLDYFHSS